MFTKFEKRPEQGLAKRVRLTPKQFHYRLALERVNYDPKKIDFDSYYEGLKEVLHARDKIWIWNSLAFTALFLFYLGALDDFDFFGISMNPSILGYVVFLLFSFSTLLFGNQHAKVVRYSSLFNSGHDQATGATKQDMILRYPRAYGSLMYANWMSGGARFMYPVKRFPIRVLLLLIVMTLAVFAWLAFTFWLLVNVSLQLWHQESPILGQWSKITVIVGWAGLAASTLLPTIAFKRVEFDHFGLSQILERFQTTNKDRYNHFIKWIARTEYGRSVAKDDAK